MKYLKPILLLGLWAPAAFAAPLCVTDGTLQSYITSNNTFANACQIGDKLFWGFSLTNVTGNEPPATVIRVQPRPFDGFSQIGISFNSGGWAADPGAPIDAFVGYFVATASGYPAIEDATLTITGTLPSIGGGTAIVTETLTPAVSGSPLVASLPSPVSQHIIFSSNTQSSFFVQNEINLSANAGATTAAHVSVVENDFSELVPEPMMPLLIGSGLLLFGFFGNKRLKR